MAPVRKPWERVDGESDVEWEAFSLWRDLAYPDGIALHTRFRARRMGDLAAILGVTMSQASALSKRCGWSLRTTQYDRYVDEIRLGVKATNAQRVGAEHAKILGNLRAMVDLELTKHKERAEIDPNAPTTSIRELLLLIDAVVKLDRLVLGQDKPEGQTETQTTDKRWNLEALSLQDLEALERARERAAGAEPVNVPDADTKH